MSKVRQVLSALLLSWLAVGLSAASAASVSAVELTSALQWRSVGPYEGGRVTTVAGVAGKPNLYYAGYAGGGVWKTEDYGIHWKNISGQYFAPGTSGSVGYMAVAPSNPNVIYVGTGDSAPRNTVTTGQGMYKSTDAGKIWKYIGLGGTHTINWIVVDPNNPNIVYVAALGHLFGPNAERGVFKTTDGGHTWKKVLYVNEHTGAVTLAMDPSNPQVLYASTWQFSRRHWTFSSGGPGSGIYKTTDGGKTWDNITHNRGLPTGIFGKVGLAVAPSNPNVVYALIQTKYKPGHPGGLFRSENGGRSWTLMNDSLNITQRAFYYMRVYVDPRNPNTIYLPNVGVYVSHNGGKKLITLHPPHGDNHAFWINPNNPQTLIEGNDGGATVSLDGGKSWSSEDNQPTGQFYHADLDNQFPFRIYGAQQDRNSNVGPSAVPFGKIPQVWTHVEGGEMSWVVPTPGKPWITYGEGYYSLLWKENRRTGIVTAVTPWPDDKFGHAGIHVRYRTGWKHHAVVFAPGDPHMLLMGANVLFESADAGLKWKIISPDLTRHDRSKLLRPGGPISADVTSEEMFDTISTIGVSPIKNSIIWVGSDDGLVHVTTDGGGHWSEVRPPSLPTWSTITCVEPSHTDPGAAYVSASRYAWDDFHPYVYKTTDYGKTWTRITTGLPGNEYVESVRQDPDDPSLLLAGTSATVYMSLDDGGQWQPMTLNLPAVRVNDIEFQPEQHAVVIATFGRAFWVLDNLQFLEQLRTADVPGNAAYLFKPQQTWLTKLGGVGFGGAGIGGENWKAGAAVFFHLPADYNGSTPVKLSFTTANGKLIRTFTLPVKPRKPNPMFGGPAPKLVKLHPGMNRFQWNLRYPNAVEIKGVFHSFFAAARPVGPEVLPGTYYAVLSYGGNTQKQPFVVKLDPRLHTTQAELQQRFDLLMHIRDAITRLDTNVNAAIDARGALEKGQANRSVSGRKAQEALASLNRDIDSSVNLKIQSGEGALVYAPRLRAWLSAITGQIGAQFVAPTPSMVKVANIYIGDVGAAVPRLRADVAAAKAALGH